MIVLTRRRKGEKRGEEETMEFSTFKEAKQAAFGFKSSWIRCDSCQAAVINGMFCHETGCPGAWKDQDVKCRECDEEFTPEERWQTICRDCHDYLEDLKNYEH